MRRKTKPKTRKYWVSLTMQVEIDEEVLKIGQSQEFADYVVPLYTPEEVAEHVAYNLAQGTTVDRLDGFYSLVTEDQARVIDRLRVDYVEECDD